MKEIDRVRQELLGEFRNEAGDKLERVAQTWVWLEGTPETPTGKKPCGEIFHSLKGEARVMGIHELVALLHAAEELAAVAIERGFKNTDELGDLLLAACDTAGQYVSALGVTSTPPSSSQCAALVQEIRHALVERAGPGGASPGPAPEPSPGEAEQTPDVRFTKPATAGEGSDEARGGSAHGGGGGGDGGDDDGGRASRPADGGSTEHSLRVPMDVVTGLSELSGELMLAHRRYERGLQDLRAQLMVHGALEDEGKRRGSSISHDDREGARAGMLSLVRDLLNHVHNGAVQTRDIVDLVRRARMIRIERVLERYVRSARDLARTAGKKARVTVEGNDVTVDKYVADRIAESVLHVVRNAVSHGLESAERRAELGKPDEGRIVLSARAAGATVSISISDDGAGIDAERVRQRATERGLLTAAEADRLEASNVLDLLFLSGFSTAEALTEVSGRGVGLDVVKHEVEGLGGWVSVQSEMGAGTTFCLQVPTSVALTRILLARVGDRLFGIPGNAVAGVLRASAARQATINDDPAVSFRNELVPLVDMLEMVTSGQLSSTADLAVVVQHEKTLLACRVAELVGQQEVAVRPLSDFFAKARLVNGACVVDSGELALVLNPAMLAVRNRGQATPRSAAGDGTAAKQAKTPHRVLVVEDSALTRNVVVGAVRGLGYETCEASDGMDALEQLEQTEVNVVLTDIDMPGMDGLELIRRIRADPRISMLPIVVLSTRASDADRRAAHAAGADDYVTKAEFSESVLRRAIERRLVSE